MRSINVTEKLINLIEVASKEVARRHRNKEVFISHLLLAIVSSPKKFEINDIDFKILKDLKQHAELEVEKLEKTLVNANEMLIPKLSEEVVKVLENTKTKFKKNYIIGVKELLYGILRGEKLLKKYKINKLSIIKNMNAQIEFPDDEIFFEILHRADEEFGIEYEYFEISKYAKNLTKLAKEKKLEPLIGREHEIETLINILSRRNKNSAILIGEPGVGKTAIIEGLATKIANKQVNKELSNKTILLMDVSSLVSGTKYRGEFEERINNFIKIIKANKNIILFIDEIHTLIGAGNSEGSLDASNILKPSLSRAEIQVIGATTYDEYRKHIEKDKAFTRRFQTININESNETETLQILKDISHNFENYHKVKYAEETLETIVTLSSRYLVNKKFPDKAIDLMDMSGSRKKQENTDEKIIKPEDIKILINQIIKNKVKNGLDDEFKELKNHQDEIKKVIIGQNDAINSIFKEIVKYKLEINDSRKPPVTSLFIGGSGSGKTFLAKEIAERIIGDKNSYLSIDMSDYKDENSLSKLIGTNPGYVGYSDGGLLVNKLKYYPDTVILFENIENAHNTILNFISQIIDNGEIMDNKENKISFKNSIIIMTTKIGSKTLLGENKIGFEKEKIDDINNNFELVSAELEKHFKSEFLSKIQNKIVFKVLEGDAVEIIYKNHLSELLKNLSSKNIDVEIEEPVNSYIIKKYYEKKTGARSILNAIKEQIEDKIIDKIIYKDTKNKIKIRLDDEKIEII